MAKKKSKKISNKSSKNARRYWKLLWVSVGVFVFVITGLTGTYLYTLKHQDVLAAIDGPVKSQEKSTSKKSDVATKSAFNPCQNTRCGAGPYCSGRCGVSGKVSDNYLYYCLCPKNNPHCKNAYIPDWGSNHSCKPQTCNYNTSGKDSCNMPTTKTAITTTAITISKFTFTCNPSTTNPSTLHIAWTTPIVSSSYLTIKITDLKQLDTNKNFKVLATIVTGGNQLDYPIKSTLKIKYNDPIFIDITDAKGKSLGGKSSLYTCN